MSFSYYIWKRVLDIVYKRPLAGYWFPDEWKIVVASFINFLDIILEQITAA